MSLAFPVVCEAPGLGNGVSVSFVFPVHVLDCFTAFVYRLLGTRENTSYLSAQMHMYLEYASQRSISGLAADGSEHLMATDLLQSTCMSVAVWNDA